MAIGVFGLQVAYRLKRLEVMSLDDTHGWFGGGSYGSTVDRIDFSNDTGTANIRGPLSLARSALAATGNSNYGWFGGGGVLIPSPFSVPQYSRVDRIDFSNDSPTASVRGPLNRETHRLAATGNSNYGWFGGGSDPGSVATVDRIDFSNDSTTASPRGPLSSTRVNLAATGNSNYGWFGGGQIPTPALASTVERIDFSNDSVPVSIRGPLTLAKRFLSATANSNYGWFGGGEVPGSPTTLYSTVDRIDFSNDSVTAQVRGPLSAAKYNAAATGNSNYGWFGGGGSTVSRVDRIDFSNDSVSASPRGPLSSARDALAATSGQAKGPAIKLQKAGNFGWFGGGTNNPSTTQYATIDRIDFSNDLATASPRAGLSGGVKEPGATGNSNYGWWAGGETPTNTSRIDRLDFSNDSAAISTRGPLTGTKYWVIGTGNSNYGWFAGGKVPGGARTSGVDRVNFSNDSTTASPRGVLTAVRYAMGATANSNYGWWGGGSPAGSPAASQTRSTVDRIDFSNDAATASPRGVLSASRYQLAATGNSNYGWFGGGSSTSIPGFYTLVDRITFSNDSVVALSRGNVLSGGRYLPGATGNSDYGWFGGGRVPSTPSFVTAAVNRINFSNDDIVLSSRGPLSLARERMGVNSNKSFS
jgi:hypothetical protein